MPNALTIGVPYELFWHLNPTKLKPFYKAFENKRKIRDEENWTYWGYYGMSALSVVLANAFSKNSQAKYIEKPVCQEMANKDRELTEEEMQKEIEKAILVEEMWIANDKRRGLPETLIK